MKKNNTKLSVALNQAIEPIVRENYQLCRIQNKDNYLLYIRDSDPDSEFFFGILSEKVNSEGHPVIEYSLFPANSSRMVTKTNIYKLDTFVGHFRDWFNNIEFYSRDSILNDPILNGYKKEYYQDFKIMDSDADTEPFAFDQQLLLDEFLDNVINNIPAIQTERNREIIDEIISDSIELQSDLTQETKNGFMKKLSAIFAKARKGGIKISKFILKEFAKEIFKESSKAMFDFAVNHSQDITKYLHI